MAMKKKARWFKKNKYWLLCQSRRRCILDTLEMDVVSWKILVWILRRDGWESLESKSIPRTRQKLTKNR